MRRALSLAILLAGCGDKSIDVSLQLPSSSVSMQYDTSCVKAVEVFVDGANYPADNKDFLRTCVELSAPAMTFAGVKAAIHDKFDTKLPTSGLSGVELFAYNGRCDTDNEYLSDLVFYGSAAYVGDDSMTLEVVPNLSCAQSNYAILPVDILKYAKTAQCAQSDWNYGTLSLSTIVPVPFTDFAAWWVGTSTAMAVGGQVTVRGMAEIIGPKSCLASGFDDGAGGGEAQCVAPMDQRLCATGMQIEQPLVDPGVGYNSRDSMKINQFGGFVVGLVGGPGPLGGATVTIDDADKDKGQVVYLDMQPGAEVGNGLLTERAGATSTGPTGLFGIYTHSFVHVTIVANGQTVHRVIAGLDTYVGAVFVKI